MPRNDHMLMRAFSRIINVIQFDALSDNFASCSPLSCNPTLVLNGASS